MATKSDDRKVTPGIIQGILEWAYTTSPGDGYGWGRQFLMKLREQGLGIHRIGQHDISDNVLGPTLYAVQHDGQVPTSVMQIDRARSHARDLLAALREQGYVIARDDS